MKMPPLDGCGRSEIALILQQKPNLDGLRGSARKFVCRTRTQFLGSPYEIANPPIYLIDRGCMLHESGYNVHCKSFLVYGEAPVRSLMQPCQRFLIKAQDYGYRNFNNKTKDQQALYEKGAGRESRDKPSASNSC